MDLVTVATLALFAAAALGGIVGAIVGWLTRFQIGLSAGLLILGGVCLWFAVRCLVEYRDFLNAGPNGAWGEVIAIEERALDGALSGTQPVPVVRFNAGDTAHTIYGPRSGSYKVGDAVSVIIDPADPGRSRVGQLSQLRGGSIAMMLFGTFPFSFGLWMLAGGSGNELGGSSRADSRDKNKSEPAARAIGRLDKVVLAALHLAMFASVLWIGYGLGTLEQRFAQGFSAAAVTLLGYAIWGAFSPQVDARWSFGLAVLAINFGVWGVALHVLLV